MNSATKQEGYGLGVVNEGEGFASPTTAWAVEVNGKINPYDVVRTREVAREIRQDRKAWGDKNVYVRKVELRVVAGR